MSNTLVPLAPARMTARPDRPGASPNRLLGILAREAPADADWFALGAEPVLLRQGEILAKAGDPIEHVWFPECAVLSVICEMMNGDGVEIGTVGLEGMASPTTFLGLAASPHLILAQVPGPALRISAPLLAREVLVRPALHRLLSLYTCEYLSQVAQTAACNRLHGIEQRCARWLLMTHDRVERAPVIRLTHAYLAVMLGVWRPSATAAVGVLQKAGIVESRRGTIRVLDRARLEAASCECYETVSNALGRFSLREGEAPALGSWRV